MWNKVCTLKFKRLILRKIFTYDYLIWEISLLLNFCLPPTFSIINNHLTGTNFHHRHTQQPPSLADKNHSPRKMPIALATLAWVSTAATWLATFGVLLLLFSRHMRRGRYNLPPGPKPWPIIGNLNLIGPLPHRSLHALSRKYGPIMRVWFGSMPLLWAHPRTWQKPSSKPTTPPWQIGPSSPPANTQPTTIPT